jgi:hypothetical protein
MPGARASRPAIDDGTGVLRRMTKPKAERRGGRRKGAGRKPNFLKRLGLQPVAAAQLLATVDEEKLVKSLLHDKSADTRLRAWMALREMVFGKPKQGVQFGIEGLGDRIAAARARQMKPAELDAEIEHLESELGIKTKTIDAPPDSLKELPAAPAPAPDTPAAPLPRHTKTTPALPAQNGHCDVHGSFSQVQSWEPCPACKELWGGQNRAEQQRLSGLLPGTPEWSRR